MYQRLMIEVLYMKQVVCLNQWTILDVQYLMELKLIHWRLMVIEGFLKVNRTMTCHFNMNMANS